MRRKGLGRYRAIVHQSVRGYAVYTEAVEYQRWHSGATRTASSIKRGASKVAECDQLLNHSGPSVSVVVSLRTSRVVPGVGRLGMILYIYHDIVRVERVREKEREREREREGERDGEREREKEREMEREK